jgi:hypothetical protein
MIFHYFEVQVRKSKPILTKSAKSEIQFPLAGRRLVRFTAVARHGRFLIMQKERDPSFFITLETLLFARRVHWYLTRVHEDA